MVYFSHFDFIPVKMFNLGTRTPLYRNEHKTNYCLTVHNVNKLFPAVIFVTPFSLPLSTMKY